MLLMEQHLGDTFEAIIIAVWKDGFAVELIDYFIEGFVPVAEIPDDYYQLDPASHALDRPPYANNDSASAIASRFRLPAWTSSSGAPIFCLCWHATADDWQARIERSR